MKKLSTIVLFLGLYSLNVSNANAEYCATGVIKGNVCKGFVIESCKTIRVDAIKDEDGKLYSINKCYPKVSEYDEAKKWCWIRTKSDGGGLFSWALNSATQPNFLHRNDDGEYEELDVEYLTFGCEIR